MPIDRRTLLASAGAIAVAGTPGLARSGVTALPVEDPRAFIVRQFAAADVVLLAEDHGVRQNLAFLQSLIPELYRAGVRAIAMEFGDADRQAALDALVTAERYDEAAARNLMFDYDSAWPLRDYWDVYGAAWRFNRTLPQGAPPFRIVNLSYRPAWEELSGPLTIESARRVFYRGPLDRFRVQVVQREILDRGDKALAFVGWPHAVTRFALPIFDYNAPDFVRLENRNLGQILYLQLRTRVRCVILHAPFAAGDGLRLLQPAGGALERAFISHGGPCAFDLRGPAGSLPDASEHANGNSEFTMGDFADGYVVLDRLDRLQGCSLDLGFVTEANFADARRRFPRELRRQPRTLAEYWDSARAFVDIGTRYAKVGVG